MEVTFELIDGLYTAEFEVKSNCNIHVERQGKGAFFILQRGTKTGKYAVVSEEDYNKTTIDVDMLGSIYPKYIKITSTSMPTYAEVNFAEQGGDGGNSGDGGLTYFDISGLEAGSIKDQIKFGASIVKAVANVDDPVSGTNSGDILIVPVPIGSILQEQLALTNIACGIPLQEMIMMVGKSFTIEDYIKDSIGEETYNSIPRITKEEFYNLEV